MDNLIPNIATKNQMLLKTFETEVHLVDVSKDIAYILYVFLSDNLLDAVLLIIAIMCSNYCFVNRNVVLGFTSQ